MHVLYAARFQPGLQAEGHHLYAGSDAAAVESADTAGPEFLGTLYGAANVWTPSPGLVIRARDHTGQSRKFLAC